MFSYRAGFLQTRTAKRRENEFNGAVRALGGKSLRAYAENNRIKHMAVTSVMAFDESLS
jgi:hypothetical protein